MASQMAPQGCARTVLIGPGGVQDGLEIVLVRFSCRLVVRDRFFGRLGLLLGSFLGAPGVVLVLFRHFNSSIQPINSSIRRFNPSTHQPTDSTHQAIISSIQPINPSIQFINSSTHGPSALSYPARRTARCAIKSAATRRVGACLDGNRNLLRILVRILRTQRVKPGPAHSAVLRSWIKER